MAEANWGPETRQATYQNQYDQGYDLAHRVEPPLVAPVSPQSHYAPHPHGVQAGYAAPMADLTEEDTMSTGAPTAPGGLGSALNYAGAALSLALIVGLGVWGYKLAVRDVTGIPVVRALEGPMRVQPENPGGQSAAHQGFAVNDVQSEGQAAAPADRLVLAPAPDELAEEDMTAEVSARADTAPGAALPLHEASAIVPAPKPTAVDPVAAALAIAKQIAADAEPLSGEALDEAVVASVAQPTVPDAASEASVPKIIPASVPGVRKSPRPSGRPADLDTRVAAAPAATNATATVTDVAPDKIAVGTRLVQLGAFDSADVARAEWDKLSVRFEDYLSGKSRVIQQAKSGGKTFYRLRVMGFDDLADARRFCSVLMAAKAACIPVVTR
ncbi:SPOR domain-containing protein [Aliiroseovarius sp. S1339]|uniref:SPOR domain-containing protein n=1 Tax=Aliiroseovarius sp. S1339 TaxID=2936990 RepID=UPI0020C0001D|nr:SPOR domain-containing protein [Aliiroseovarius sp. S1339]MCK8462687.1 SPOR domain-containing protein [Aliiroseovarius sp. S1339]